MAKVLERVLPIGAIVLGLVLLSVAIASGQTRDIEGLYRVTGTNPGGVGEYRGEVAVARTGEVYQVAWTISGARHLGTGVLTDDILSVVYQPEGEQAGIAVYELQRDGSLEGVWTSLGGQTLGTERWVPQGRM